MFEIQFHTDRMLAFSCCCPLTASVVTIATYTALCDVNYTGSVHMCTV